MEEIQEDIQMGAGNSTSTTVEVLVETLKQSIQQGTLKPGDKLPTLKEMEEIYCVSRIVIREAIKVLEGQGFIYSRQGSGIYVKEHESISKSQKLLIKEYTLGDIYSLFNYIYDLATVELKKLDDFSEILELQKLNKEMIDNYSKLTSHQKFMYETNFGLRLIRLSKNQLAYDLYFMFMKPLSDIDYMTISNGANFYEMLKIDESLIQAILEKNTYRAKFLGEERCTKELQGLKDKDDIMKRTYKISLS